MKVLPPNPRRTPFGRNSAPRWKGCWSAAFVVLIVCSLPRPALSDEGLSAANREHFAGLRARGLHRLAEAELEHRLSWPRLPPAIQTELVLELAETLLGHARRLNGSQRVPLWERTREVLRNQLALEQTGSRQALLELQLVLVDREVAEASRRQVPVSPWHLESRQRGLQAAIDGLNRLRRVQSLLEQSVSRASGNKPGAIPVAQRVRLQVLQGELESCAVECLPEDSADRAARALAARQVLQPLVEHRTEIEQAERARVLLARVLRVGGEPGEARRLIDAARSQSRDPSLREALLREEVECRLGEGEVAEARRVIGELAAGQSANPGDAGENWETRLLQARVLLASWRSGVKMRSQLASRDFQAAREVLSQGAESAPEEWRELFALLSEIQQEEQTLGPELSGLSLQIRQALAANQDREADRLLARGAELARRRGLTDRAAEWGLQRGSLALEREDWEAAAQDLLSVSREFPESPRAAEAQLLGAYALGRTWRTEKSDDSRRDYRDALEQFCQRFPDDSRRPEAEWMWGELCRWEGRLVEAADHFDRVPRGHPRTDAATLALVELARQMVQEGHHDLLDVMRERLWGRLPPDDEPLRTPDLPVAMTTLEVELSVGSPAWPHVNTLLERLEKGSPELAAPSPGEPPESIPNPPGNLPTSADFWGLRLVAAAAQGRWADVDRLWKSPPPHSARKLLALCELRDRVPPGDRMTAEEARLNQEFRQRMARFIEACRDELSPGEWSRFAQGQARLCASAKRVAEAREWYQQAIEGAPLNSPERREFALFLLELPDAPSRQAGVDLLTRREKGLKAGTEEWLDARLELARGLTLVDRAEEACRLLRKTQLLFPSAGTAVQRGRLREFLNRWADSGSFDP
jgi:TolA-binding protein